MRAFIAGAVICLSLTLTACSAPASPSAAPSSPTAAPTSPSAAPASPSVAPTSSLRIEGPGYSYPIPTGWSDASAEFKATSDIVQNGAIDYGDTSGFPDNISVISLGAINVSLTQFKQGYPQAMTSGGMTDVQVMEPVWIGGEEAMQVWANLPDSAFSTIHYALVHNGEGYVVAVLTDRAPGEAHQQIGLPLLTGWTWS